jgi:hypothetical protein
MTIHHYIVDFKTGGGYKPLPALSKQPSQGTVGGAAATGRTDWASKYVIIYH